MMTEFYSIQENIHSEKYIGVFCTATKTIALLAYYRFHSKKCDILYIVVFMQFFIGYKTTYLLIRQK